MSNLEMWAIIVGVLMPPIVGIVEKDKWPNWVKSIVMIVSSMIAGGVTSYLQNGNDWNTKNWIHVAMLIGIATITAYYGFWKHTSIPNVSLTVNRPTPPPSAGEPTSTVTQ